MARYRRVKQAHYMVVGRIKRVNVCVTCVELCPPTPKIHILKF